MSPETLRTRMELVEELHSAKSISLYEEANRLYFIAEDAIELAEELEKKNTALLEWIEQMSNQKHGVGGTGKVADTGLAIWREWRKNQ